MQQEFMPYMGYPMDAFIPRSYSRSSDGSGSPSRGGGGLLPPTLDPQLVNMQADMFQRENIPMSYPGPSFDPRFQRQNMDAFGQGLIDARSSSPIPPHKRTQSYLKDGPPEGVPDPGDYLRQKHHIPPGVEVNLNALSDPLPGQKPPHPLPTLISLAIYGSPRKMLTLQEIYAVIERRFEWFRVNPKEGWKNSIRHNLSLNLLFRKKNRPITEPGKGHYWYIDITSGEGNKRPRKRRSRRNEDDDSDSFDEDAESPSPSFMPSMPYENMNIDPTLLHESVSVSMQRRGPVRRWNSTPVPIPATRHSSRLQQQYAHTQYPQQMQMHQGQFYPTQQYTTSNPPSTSYHESYLAAVELSGPRMHGGQQQQQYGHYSRSG